MSSGIIWYETLHTTPWGYKSIPNSNSPVNPNNVNTVQTAPQQNSINTNENPEIFVVVNKIKNTSSENSHAFLRVLPVKNIERK